MSIAGLVLAAGRSSRFGAEKAMALLGGRPLLDHAVGYLRPACGMVAVNAPSASSAAVHARDLGLPIVEDAPSDPKGPLAGLRAGLLWARKQQARMLILTPCDTPRVPASIALELASTEATAVVRTHSGLQPLHSIWAVEPALDAITACFADGRHPAVKALLSILNAREVLCTHDTAFANINRPADLGVLSTTTHVDTRNF